MKSYQTIQVLSEPPFLTIRLNRPEVHNALNAQMIEELTRVLTDMNIREGHRALVIRGNGPSFCSGADLNYMKQLAEKSREENLQDAQNLAALFRQIYSFPLPVIALVHGTIAGGAMGLVAASDICLAEKDSRFVFSEVKIGLVPATIAPYVIRKTGYSRASELMLSARSFGAMEAVDAGLVHLVCNTGNLEQDADEYMKRFRHLAPGALKATKQMLQSLLLMNHEEEVAAYTARLIAEKRASEEGKEGLNAFIQKRNPSWKLN